MKLGRRLVDGLLLAGGGKIASNSFGILGCGGGPRLNGSGLPANGLNWLLVGLEVGGGLRVGGGMLDGSGVVTAGGLNLLGNFCLG